MYSSLSNILKVKNLVFQNYLHFKIVIQSIFHGFFIPPIRFAVVEQLQINFVQVFYCSLLVGGWSLDLTKFQGNRREQEASE